MASASVTLPDSRKIAYSLDTSPQDGPVVLLATSLCTSSASWDHVVPLLNKSGFRTLRYDPPGHGDSSVPARLESTTFASLADDVHHLLQNLGISQLHAWIGVSMGAATGIYFVTQHPGVVRKAVICDTISSSPGNAGVDDAFGPRVAAARAAGSMDAAVQGSLERWFGAAWMGAHPDETQRMRGLMLRTTVDGLETCCHALRSDSFDLRPRFGSVGAGVEDALCVVGDKDANLPQTMELMRAQIEQGFAAAGRARDIELRVVRNAGHVCFIDGLDDFMHVVSSFLKS